MFNRKLLNINLRLFDGNTNVTTDSGMSAENKTFYSDRLVDFARPQLVHSQFGQKHGIPKGGGKTIEFRKYSPLPKLTTPLAESVTPNGQKLTTSVITQTIAQYGGFIELSDVLLLTAIDNNLVMATELLGDQAGRTLDTIVRNELVAGTNVQYGADAVSARYLLVGGEASGNHYLVVDCVKRAVRKLKVMNTKTYDANYVSIIHPDCSYDITNDDAWKDPHKYVDTDNLYTGEIGKIFNTRFVETTEAMVFQAAGLTAAARNLTVKTTLSVPGKTVAVDEAITAGEATALVGRKVIIGTGLFTVASAEAGAAGAATITTTADVTVAQGTDGIVVYPGEAGAKGRDIYATLVIGKDAYGVIEVDGGGLKHIVKQLGSAGTSDPLDQRATAGWKAITATKRLVEEFMVRVETASTFSEH